MTLPAAPLTLELIPHCTSVARDGWAGDHDVRPLAELGMRQARVLLATLSSARAIPRPPHVGRGGWYTLRFAGGGLAITPHDPGPA